MKSIRARWLLPAAAAASLLFLSGCNNDDTSTEPKNQPKPSVQSNRREKLEPMDENSGEFSRRHVFDELDREVETQINYRNGESATYYFREDGKTREYVRRAKNGTVKQRKVYDKDGTTVLEGQESRSDGTTLWVMEKQADGSTKTTTYWFDGKRVFSVEIRKPGGSFETSFYHKNGQLWSKQYGTGTKVAVEEHFDRNGVQTLRIESPNPTTSVVIVYDKGKPQARQTWKIETNSWSGTMHTLQQVEELDANGKVTRKLTMDSGGWSVKETETFNADGTRVVRTLRYDGTIGKEETFDKAGKSTAVKEYKDDERITETVDRQLLRRSYPDDPKNSWNMQEYYPYYRYQDEP